MICFDRGIIDGEDHPLIKEHIASVATAIMKDTLRAVPL
jgi:hypothetical protein